MCCKGKLGFLLLAVAAAALSACNNSGDNGNNPVSVKVQKVCVSSESHPQSYIGRIEAGKSTLINSTCPGRLTGLYVVKGQKVKRGAPLGIIDSPTVTSVYSTALASFNQAQDALNRVKQVYGTGSVSDLKMLDVQTSYDKAEAALKAAKSALDDCTVKAPYDGVVGDIMVNSGVEIAIGQPLFRFLDVNSVEVHASIPEKEYSAYALGQKAEVCVDAVGVKVKATLVSKGVEASHLSHSYDFVFKPYYCGKMMPGMVCKVYMTSKSVCSSVVPSSAVRVDAEGSYVWCVDSTMTVVKRRVEVGGFVSDGVEVYSGLADNDLVVVDGGRRISSGMKNIKVDDGR